MKFIIHNTFPSFILLVVLAMANVLEMPLSLADTQNKQSIHINAAQQTINIATNTVIVTGEVSVKSDFIDIYADKIIITRVENKNGNEVLEGYGNPVIFYQRLKNSKPIHGHSKNVRYEVANDLIVLTGNAYLAHLDNNIQSDRIIYMIKKQYIEAFSDKSGKQVRTVLTTTQLNNK